jgi:hypothetical protein
MLKKKKPPSKIVYNIVCGEMVITLQKEKKCIK